MAKKKEVYKVYTPLAPPQEIKGAVEQVGKNIPPYPDLGTIYAGYAKRLLSGDIYALVKQEPYVLSIGLGTDLNGLLAGTYTVTRNFSDKNFLFDNVIVTYKQTTILNEFVLSDSGYGNHIILELPATTNTNTAFSFNKIPTSLSSTTFNVTISQDIALNEFISILLYGWLENK